MRLFRVTITGADDKVDHEDLLRLSVIYPFVEWGILFSKSNKGTKRFPSEDWVEALLYCCPKHDETWQNPYCKLMNLSAHLCGDYSKEIMNGEYHFSGFKDVFKRFQINFNFRNSEFDIDKFLDLKCDYNEFIFQYNKSNEFTIGLLLEENKGRKNLNILYDSSGGRGIEIKKIKTPFEVKTGYSGGLNPDNVEDFIRKLSKPYDCDVWIDMESGVRTNNEFDLSKVEKVLEICNKYIN